MAVRTLSVQIPEELFVRFKAAVAKKGCRQKDFLIALIERAAEEIGAESGEEKVSGISEEEKESVMSEEETAVKAPPAEQEPESDAIETGEPEESENEEETEPIPFF